MPHPVAVTFPATPPAERPRPRPYPTAPTHAYTSAPPPPASWASAVNEPGLRLGLLGRLTGVLLAVNVIVSVMLILAVRRQYQLIVGVESGTRSVSRQAATDTDDWAVLMSHLSTGAFLVTGIVFLTWLFRADRSAWRHNQLLMRHGSGWAIGGWFVPFLNFVRPYQVMTDVDNASTLSPDARSYDREPRWRIRIWWALFLVAGGLWRVADSGNPSTLPALKREAVLEMVGESCYVLAAIAAIVVVAGITAANDRRRGELIDRRAAGIAAGRPVAPLS